MLRLHHAARQNRASSPREASSSTTDRHGIATRPLRLRPDAISRARTPLPFDPIELKLSAKTYETSRLKACSARCAMPAPITGAVASSKSIAVVAQLGEIDYLLYSPDDRAGALGFGLHRAAGPAARTFNQTIDLAQLQALADALIARWRTAARPRCQQVAGSDAARHVDGRCAPEGRCRGRGWALDREVQPP